MKFFADLHIHSYLSRACSPSLHPETLHRWGQLKGVTVLSTGDFTHPKWFSELREKLVPAEPGLFALKSGLARMADEEVPVSCRAPLRFLLGVEISCIYKKKGRTRRLHHLVFAPSFKAAAEIRRRLSKIGNLRSDGRPILGLDSKDLLAIVLESSDDARLIPAHAWTPHFGLFGSESGFDSIEECFGDLAPHIFAIETGLSSDPAMNRRLSALDRIALVSNSDAHSPEKLAREANLLDTDLSYRGVFNAVRRPDSPQFVKTIEFFSEQGKYHLDGHRKCRARLEPKKTRRLRGLCPVCGKRVTVGVLARVEALADRNFPPTPPSFESLVSLKEMLGQTLRVGPSSVKVDSAYHRLLAAFGSELHILREASPDRLESEGYPLLALALERMRKGQINIQAGYDGEYGTIQLLTDRDFKV